MAEVERIEEWRGEPVIDPDGEQVGKLDEVFYDATSGEPLLLAVKTGKLRSRSRLVPIAGATVGRGHLRVAFKKDMIESAAEMPGIDALDAKVIDGVESTYGVALPEELELWSATEMEARRAEAEAARQRAEELEHEADAKLAQSDAAKQQAEGAASDADVADREAQRAQQEAADARAAAVKYETP
jgi:sporulation protein YlmC with PRC-barrel domain